MGTMSGLADFVTRAEKILRLIETSRGDRAVIRRHVLDLARLCLAFLRA